MVKWRDGLVRWGELGEKRERGGRGREVCAYVR